jgi:hypothetical protein
MNYDEAQKILEDQLDKEAEREKLYEQQANEIALGLTNGRKVNDGYYIWAMKVSNNNKCCIVAARRMLVFQKGYKPMIAEFVLNKERTLFDNVQAVIEIMLKKQNGEYIAEEITEIEE